MRGIVQWRKKSEGFQTMLDWRFDCLTSNPYLEDKINQTVASEEEVADTASSALADIRRKMRRASQKKSTGTIRQHDTFQYLSKIFAGPNCYHARRTLCSTCESGISREVPGLVHDTSSSGSTLFIEPMSVVEAK